MVVRFENVQLPLDRLNSAAKSCTELTLKLRLVIMSNINIDKKTWDRFQNFQTNSKSMTFFSDGLY